MTSKSENNCFLLGFVSITLTTVKPAYFVRQWHLFWKMLTKYISNIEPSSEIVGEIFWIMKINTKRLQNKNALFWILH